MVSIRRALLFTFVAYGSSSDAGSACFGFDPPLDGSCPPAEPPLKAGRTQGNHLLQMVTARKKEPTDSELPVEIEQVLKDVGDAGITSTYTYNPHFDTTPDYLNITSRVRGIGSGGAFSDNYYLVLGDAGGCSSGVPGMCARQKVIANQAAQYVSQRKAKNPNSELLFVLYVGDNFYWNGANDAAFRDGWSNVYSKDLLSVPWFAVMGNHDYGNTDPGAACPNVKPRFKCGNWNANTPACGGARPYSTEYQAYDSNQLDQNKGGSGGSARANYHMPDFTYYYSIPALDFEILALDWNAMDVNGLGGAGYRGGAQLTFQRCGWTGALQASLNALKDASTKLLRERALAAEYRNVAIISHYPDEFQGGINFRRMYLSSAPGNRTDSLNVMNFFGHTHVQQCRVNDPSGMCTDFLTGGGGGCCGAGDLPGGFAVISWDDSRKQKVECFAGQSSNGLSCNVVKYW